MIYDVVYYALIFSTHTKYQSEVSAYSLFNGKHIASLSTLLAPPPALAVAANTTGSLPYPPCRGWRNGTHPEGNSITVFSAIKNGNVNKFKLVNSVGTGLNHAGGTGLEGDDKWLVVGGVDKGGVKIFERNGMDLKPVEGMTRVVAPTGIRKWSYIHKCNWRGRLGQRLMVDLDDMYN